MTIDTKVWARLPPNHYTYFFRQLFAGDKGVKQDLTARFFAALYNECQRRGIKAEWDPSNPTEINKLMDNLNFTAHYGKRRRPANKSSKHPKESFALADDTGAVDGASDQVS